MRVLVVADLHGAQRRLAKMLRPDDLLISLGDHINVLDYKDLSGLLADFVPRPAIEATLAAISSGQMDEARRLMTQAAGSVPDLFAKVRHAAHEAYRELNELIPCRAHFIYGNVDFPDVIEKHLTEPRRLCVAETLEIEGRRFGLVSGHPPGPFNFGMPGEVARAEFAKRLHAVGGVDVLCLHSPPDIAELTYDVEAGRDERGSEDTLYYARLKRPRLVLFGHVHQPRAAEYVDREVPAEPIRYLNVGCFRDTGRILQIEPRTFETWWIQAE